MKTETMCPCPTCSKCCCHKVAGLEDQVGNCVNADEGICKCDEDVSEDADRIRRMRDQWDEWDAQDAEGSEDGDDEDGYSWDDDMAAERDEELGVDVDEDMDGDFDSAMASAGFGTNEDYGDYGDDGGEDF